MKLLLALLSLPILIQAQSPNIVYILADDMGVGDVSVLNSHSKIKTPALDSLANEGRVFNDAHSGSSVCTPTRYSLLTGRHAWRTKLKERVLDAYSPCLIPKERDTVASLLKRNGYKTAMIGKWHLGLDWTPKPGKSTIESEQDVDFSKPITHGPLDLGFDYWYGPAASWDMAPYAFMKNRMISSQNLIPTNPKTEHYPRPQEYLDAKANGLTGKELNDIMKKYPKAAWRKGLMQEGMKATDAMPLITEGAVEYIKDQSTDQAFFLYMPLTAPHTPVTPSERWRGKSGAGSYGDFVLEVDWSVGEVIKALKEKGLFENTLIIFTADNGASLKAIPQDIVDKYQHNPHYIYSGAKGRTLEGGHRVPFIASWPKAIPANSQCDSTVSLNDLYATCAELLSEEIADNTAEDSVSILAELKGEAPKAKERILIHQSFPGDLAIRLGDWKLSYLNTPNKTALINLADDIKEENNLIKTNPEKAQELKKVFAQVIREGRSTPGATQSNEGPETWKQIEWIKEIQ
ncbi:arylsulfatase [Lentisphaera marina]|uniref:sulfatase family protein n=1 Tax=Lentisphaera marina TaxID=1111041 RepID=UPI002365D07C|nr:arylsulfatase [Lentisphaera marina]MDD7984155.1 arylsulfatase [Lentisphaera marina]